MDDSDGDGAEDEAGGGLPAHPGAAINEVAATAGHRQPPMSSPASSLRRLASAQLAAVPAFAAVALMIVWSAHDGGFDEDTWYWGALVMIMLLVVSIAISCFELRLPRPLKLALLGFALYVAWSYMSIAWAASPGDALSGSNRALLYLLAFSVLALTPWTTYRALAILLVYAVGVGVIGALLLLRMAGGRNSASLFVDGRLLSPTGYINASAALFTAVAFVAIALAVRRDLPAPARGFLAAISCGCLQLALLAESRGWLFLLPLMLAAAIAVLPARLRTIVAVILPAAGSLAVLPQLLNVFKATEGANPTDAAVVKAAEHAERAGLIACGVVLIVATVLAMIDARARARAPSPLVRRALGTVAATIALAVFVAAGLAGTNGHPFAFVRRQLNGSVTQLDTFHGSHFVLAGTGRFDIWRVSLDALAAHPIGGLGQDNFVEYYYQRRHSFEEPLWTHSLELRLLTHTGIVGLGLFAFFLAASLTAAIRTRRLGSPAGPVAGIALLPLVVWLIHGSVDWFWEMPALTGPALGFLGMAGALGTAEARADEVRPVSLARPLPLAVGGLAFVAAVVVLGFPYLSVREVSTASDIRLRDPIRALNRLQTAADLNPLSADPERLAGTIALQNELYGQGERRFRQAIARDPGGWYAWLGAGLAASGQGQRAVARRDFLRAASINNRQPAVTEALRRVDTATPLTPGQAFNLIMKVQ